MKMRRPAAIFRGRPDVRESLASRNALTDLEFVEGLCIEMSVKREELFAVSRLVTQNHERTVILRSSVIG